MIQLGPGASYKDVEGQPGQLGALLPTSFLRAPKGQMLVKFHLNLRRTSLETGGNLDPQVKWVRAGRTLQPSGPDAGRDAEQTSGSDSTRLPYKELPGPPHKLPE